MDNSVFGSDVQQLRAVTKQISTLTDDLSGELRLLKNEADSITVSWKGEAGRKLIAGLSSDIAQLEEAVKELNELHEVLKSVCIVDEESEQSLDMLVSGLRI